MELTLKLALKTGIGVVASFFLTFINLRRETFTEVKNFKKKLLTFCFCTNKGEKF